MGVGKAAMIGMPFVQPAKTHWHVLIGIMGQAPCVELDWPNFGTFIEAVQSTIETVETDMLDQPFLFMEIEPSGIVQINYSKRTNAWMLVILHYGGRYESLRPWLEAMIALRQTMDAEGWPADTAGSVSG